MPKVFTMKTVPLGKARAELSNLIAELQKTNEPVFITKDGQRAAVILSADEFDSMIETLDILSDPETMADLKRSRAEYEAGAVFTSAEVFAELKTLGRL